MTNLVVQWPGSVHDSRIFKNYTLYNDLSSGNLDGYLIADSGYALASFCLTPYLNTVGDIQKNYNVEHKHTRSLVERTCQKALLLHGLEYQTEAGQNPVCHCSLFHSPQRSETAL